MNQYYVNFRSVTTGQKAIQILQKAGITARLLRTPKDMAKEGCGYSVRVNEQTYTVAVGVLRSSGVAYSKVFRVDSAGKSWEVS